MKRKAWQGGLSLVELIVALTLLSGVLLMTVTVRFNFQGLVNMGMNQAILFLNTHLALDRIVSAIQHANYLEIDAPNSTLTLSRKVGEDYIHSSYYRDPGGNLCYQPDLSASPLPSPEIVLPSVTGFQLTGFPEGGERFQMARVRLEAEDPRGIARRDAMFQTAAFCRIFHGSYKPVRVVTRDSSGNVTTVKGSYDTIQAAIDAETTVNGDVVQVSSNDKTPYVENVVISKELTLEGGYDSANWERHYADPDKPGQIHEDYETIVNSKNPTYGTIFSGLATKLPQNSRVLIDGFTISSASGGVAFSGEKTMSLKISNNKISVTGAAVRFSGGLGVSVDVTGNIIGNSEMGSGSSSFYMVQTRGVFSIKDNRFENVARYGFLWPVHLSQCQGSLEILNNKFSHLSGKSADPKKSLGEVAAIYIVQHKAGDTLTIANNSFESLSGDTGATVLDMVQSKFTEVTFKNNLARNCINQAGFNYVEISQSSSFADFTFQNNRIVGIASYSNGRVLSFSQSYFDGPLRVNNNDMSYVNGVIYLSATKWTKDGLEMTNNTAVRGTTAGSGTGVSLNFSKEYAPSLYRNYIHGFSTGLYASGTFSNAISNNVFANNTEYGVYFINAGSSYSDTPTFSNNVVFGSKIGFYGISLYSGDNRIINSVFWGNQKDFEFLGGSGITVEFNDTEKGVPVKAGVTAVNNLTLDPEFVDAANSNFALKSASPLIDAGKTVIDAATPANNYFDPSDNLSTPPSPLDRARLPAQGTIKTDIGAYGGPHAGVIGFVMPTEDDPSTPLIREDVIGTY